MDSNTVPIQLTPDKSVSIAGGILEVVTHGKKGRNEVHTPVVISITLVDKDTRPQQTPSALVPTTNSATTGGSSDGKIVNESKQINNNKMIIDK
jgi:hypothetical protein